MPIDNHTGLGATVTGLSGIITVGNWEVVAISGINESIPVLEATHLGSADFNEKVPGPLKEPAQITLSVYWNWGESIAAIGTVDAMTITFPTNVPGLTTPGSYAGSGFMVSTSVGDLVAGTEKIQGTMVFQFDGKASGPTYTAST